MRDNFILEKTRSDSGDYILIGLLLLLVAIGLSSLFSASYYYGEKVFHDSFYFFKRQLFLICISFCLIYFVYKMPLELIKKIIPYILFVSLILMLFTFIPGIGAKLSGARRWIILFGFSFQPSELVKVALVMYLAHIFSKKEEKIDDFINTILPPFLIVSFFVFLIYLQNDFSTAVFVFIVALLMFLIARVRLTFFIYMGVALVSFATIFVFTKEYRVRRLITFLDPQHDPIGSGYQIIASKSALMNGGLWGQGVGSGVKKLGGLPEAHSDFIFAVFGEEMGYIGVLFIIVILILFAFRCYSIALNMENKFEYYLAFGFTTSLLLQAMLNMAVVSGLVPATGIPFPFFSHGGSSIFTSLFMCGILLNMSKFTIKGERNSI